MTRDKQKKLLVEILSKAIVPSNGLDEKESLAEFLLDNGVEIKEPATPEKCNSYRVESYRRYLTEFEKGAHFALTKEWVDYVNETRGVCWGTKEIDECSCGGDPRKCDFYPEKREKK